MRRDGILDFAFKLVWMYKKRIKNIFIFKYGYFIVFACLISSFLNGENNSIESIDKDDREKLEHFFQCIIHRSSLGYSLCGEKPLATETFISLKKIPKNHKHRIPKIIFEHYNYSILWSGWKCWERYAHLFPSQHFVLRFIEKLDTLLLVNKSACKRTIELNIDLFHKYLKIKDTPEEILDRICFPKDNEECIFKHIGLLGILYGYGRNNSMAFANRSYIQRLEPWTRNQFFDPFFGYGFIIINNGTNEEENKAVIEVFEKANKNIQIKFQSKSNFEVFLELYTQ